MQVHDLIPSLYMKKGLLLRSPLIDKELERY